MPGTFASARASAALTTATGGTSLPRRVSPTPVAPAEEQGWFGKGLNYINPFNLMGMLTLFLLALYI